jgi:ATP-binding cassette, subfamily B, multidrug efflux pump
MIKKNNIKIGFSKEESPVLSKIRAISKGRKKFNLKELFKQTKRIIAFGKQYHIYLYLSLFGVFASTLFDLLAPVFLGKAIDCIITINNVDFSKLLFNIALLGIFYAMSSLFTFISDYFSNVYCFKAGNSMRKQIFDKFNTVPLKFIDSNQHGDLLSRMINDVDLLTDGILEGLSGITNGVITILGTLIFMFILNVPLALIILIVSPLSLIICSYIAKKSYKLYVEQAKSEGELNGFLEEYISSDRLVSAFNNQDSAIESFKKINDKYYDVSEKATFFSNLSNPTTRFINGLVYIIVAFVGATYALKGQITIGLISSFLNYANSFGKPFNLLSSEISELQAAVASTDRIFYILDANDEVSDKNNKLLASVDGNIDIKDVSFSYSPKTNLIEHFNLSVKKGQKIAIVGPTGCGKTTLINLLMRFYDTDSGDILVDNYFIKELTRDSLRNKYGMVLQESWIFSGTIRENIAYGNPNASIDEVIEASKSAGCSDFIDKLKDGYNTLISEGGQNLSQGQKQLICIARVMLIKPPMLILDEATSNIDTRTELKIQEAFSLLMKDRTTFIVAHRLSTIQNADMILVMNKGNIIEQGTHKELLEKHGFYYYLYNSQFEIV